MSAREPEQHRPLPVNIEAEQALLGAILVNNAAYERVAGFLDQQHFTEPLHQRIFGIAAELIRMGKLANPVTIKTFLAADQKVGDMTVPQYLARLAAEAVTVINARDYGLAVHEIWVNRQAIIGLQDAVELAFRAGPGVDVLSEIAPVENRLAELRAERIKGETRKSVGRLYLDSFDPHRSKGSDEGAPICLPEIARVLSEPTFEAGNLYGLLSSSGEGKTSLTLQIVSYCLSAGHPTLLLSFDQSPQQCGRQMAAQRLGIEVRRQRERALSEQEWLDIQRFGEWLEAAPHDIIKCIDQNAAQLVGLARTFVKRRGNGKTPLIVVDHIGSVEPEDRRADEGTKAKGINKIFKAGAEMTGAAWLVLNQRNSKGMARDNPRPIGSDLFGGDPAKQAYDAIFYVYRFKKFFEERKAVAIDRDWKTINAVFPEAVRNGSEDIAEIGAIKVRFGSPSIKENLIFEGQLTRYRSEHPDQQGNQQDMGFR